MAVNLSPGVTTRFFRELLLGVHSAGKRALWCPPPCALFIKSARLEDAQRVTTGRPAASFGKDCRSSSESLTGGALLDRTLPPGCLWDNGCPQRRRPLGLADRPRGSRLVSGTVDIRNRCESECVSSQNLEGSKV